MRAISLHALDPAHNLALEECLFDSVRPDDEEILLLWRNGPSVIVGRHQCAAEEIDAAFVARRGIPVIRRMTGGGAVYHDEGNLNFSFIGPAPASGRPDFIRRLEPVCAALADLGVDARISGRNDLEVDGRKISGSAMRRSRNAVLHHGTLLVNPDFDSLVAALSPDPEKHRSRGVPSVRARVAGLADFWRPGTTMDDLRAALIRRCADGEMRPDPALEERARILAETKYRSWQWNFGDSPPFSVRGRRRFPWGCLDVRLDVRRGVIAAARVHGDFFSADGVADLERRLAGVRHERSALEEALRGAPWEDWFSGCRAEDVREFILSLE